MISAGDFRNGVTIEFEGNIYQIIARKVPSANSGATAGTSRLWQPTIILSSLRIVVGYLDSAWNGWNKLAVTMEVNV